MAFGVQVRLTSQRFRLYEWKQNVTLTTKTDRFRNYHKAQVKTNRIILSKFNIKSLSTRFIYSNLTKIY